ncbi:MAG: 50S ribosomal protein L30e [Candidatus Aenigmarchaeota archaeon]|nr:50S ribosomal protein L30e [Candidatus Aenigmarchaeota archaeon]
MTVVEEIQSSIKSNKTIIGYNESITFIKTGKPKLVVVANNLPVSSRKEIEHNAKVGKIKLEVFDGTSRELGVICGKPYPVSAIVIKG